MSVKELDRDAAHDRKGAVASEATQTGQGVREKSS